MKDGWVYTTIDDCCNVNYGTRVVRKNVTGDKYPVYGGGGETFRMDDYNREDCLVISRFAMSKQCTRLVKGKFFLNDSGLSLTPKDEEVLLRELLERFILASNDTIYSYGRGSAQRNLNMNEFRRMPVSYPKSLSEQEEIVTYLDTSFAKIDAIKANAEKELEEAKKLFTATLNEAMTPKEGWVEKTLREIGITQTGTTPSKSKKENYGDYMPFIRPSEININGNGALDYDSELKLSEQGANVGRVFQKGSILMVCIGATISKVGYCVKTVSCNQQINVLTPSKDYDYKFLFYAMSNRPFREKVIKEGTSSQATLPIINKGKWEQLKLTVPPLEVQQSIVTHLDTLSEKVRQLQSNYEKISSECDALKQAILRDTFE